MRFARLPSALVVAAVMAAPVTAPAEAKDKPVSAQTAVKAQKLLKKAVGDAEVAYDAEGKLEVQAFSLENTQAYDLLQKVQVNSVGDAYKCGKSVEAVYDDVAAGVRLYKRGDSSAARVKVAAALRQDVPSLRTWLAKYRGTVLGLASDVNYAVTAVGKPWMANPAIQENLDEALLRLDSRLRQVQKLAR